MEDQDVALTAFKLSVEKTAEREKITLTPDKNMPYDDADYRRFLQAKGGNIEVATRYLLTAVQWRQKTKPAEIAEEEV